MAKEILIALLNTLLAVMNEETVKGFIDKGLDFVEDAIAASPTKWDDMMVLPVIEHFRKILNIPDNDPVVEEAPK